MILAFIMAKVESVRARDVLDGVRELEEVEEDCKKATKILEDGNGNPQKFVEYCSKLEKKWGKMVKKTPNS